LEPSVKKHYHGLYDGAGVPNLFRFTSFSIVNLVNWQKNSKISNEEFIFESNQEVYRKMWTGTETRDRDINAPLYLRKLLPVIYNSRNSSIKYFLAKIIIKLNMKKYSA
jgi:hypothetical protein